MLRRFNLQQFEGSQVLVIDDEPFLCETLRSMFQFWQMEVTTCSHPREALNHPTNPGCDLIMLDIYFSGTTGLEAMPELLARFPDAKVIIMTGYADKQNAMQALKLGAFDFLEKPFEADILAHSVRRALGAKDKEDRVKRLVVKLQESEAQLIEQNERLEYFNEQLMKTNKAMSVLAQNITREREETEKRIAIQLRTTVMPVIQRLAGDRRFSEYAGELEIVMSQIVEELTSGKTMDAQVVSALSFAELRVASLIKNGLTTEEIAHQLHISPSTVKTHRRNIRKKLNINNSKVGLRSFLTSLPEEIDNG